MPIPTIGIGASAACDGQVLVLEDMLGLSPRVPKFVKRYGDLGPGIEKAVAGYADEVRSRDFPGPAHVYPMKGEKPAAELRNRPRECVNPKLTIVGELCLVPATSLGYAASLPPGGAELSRGEPFVADIFQEIDEEVRREQLQKLWERYSIYIIAAGLPHRRRRLRLARL